MEFSPARAVRAGSLAIGLIGLFGVGCSNDGPTATSLPRLPGWDGRFDFADTLTVDGFLRRFWVHLPADYDHNLRRSLLIVYHGAGAGAQAMQTATGLDTLADTHGFAVVYPSAWSGTWAEGCDCTPAEEQGVDDVRFARQLIRHLAENYAIDPSAAFATGFSQGGFFIERMMCEEESPVRAIAAVGATMRRSFVSICPPGREARSQLPVLIMHGDADSSVPAEGSETSFSVDETALVLAQLNRCRGEPEISFPPLPPSTSALRIRRAAFSNCARGASVRLDVVEGGRHTWFGSLDSTSPIRASEAIVDFLRSAGM